MFPRRPAVSKILNKDLASGSSTGQGIRDPYNHGIISCNGEEWIAVTQHIKTLFTSTLFSPSMIGMAGGHSGRRKHDDEYEVEAIRAMRLHEGKVQYLIKWKGWPEGNNTWEPRRHLVNCNAALRAYEKRMKSQQTDSLKAIASGKESMSGSKKQRLDIGDKQIVKKEAKSTSSSDDEGRSLQTDGKAGREIVLPSGLTVVRVLKALRFDNTDGDLNVTFKVLRSDGQEELLDNKYLRAYYPYLLLDFYERRVRHR